MYRYLFLLLVISSDAFSQLRFSGEAITEAMISMEEKLPFWMYHHQRGRVSENTNFAGWITGRGNYDFSLTTNLEVGGGLLYRDGIGDGVFIDELYAHLEIWKLYFTVGRKQQEELYNGLSASNRSILWSVNPRPLPGIQIGTQGPIFLSGNGGLELKAPGMNMYWKKIAM